MFNRQINSVNNRRISTRKQIYSYVCWLITKNFDEYVSAFWIKTKIKEKAINELRVLIIDLFNEYINVISSPTWTFGITWTFESIKNRPDFKLWWVNLNSEYNSLERVLRTSIVEEKICSFKWVISWVLPFLRDSVYNLNDEEVEKSKSSLCLCWDYYVTEKWRAILNWALAIKWSSIDILMARTRNNVWNVA